MNSKVISFFILLSNLYNVCVADGIDFEEDELFSRE